MNHLYQIRQINIKQKHNNQDQLSIFWILPGTIFSDTLSQVLEDRIFLNGICNTHNSNVLYDFFKTVKICYWYL